MQDCYFKDARAFKPTRWDKRGEADVLFPMASSPYGFGKRKCIGFRIAQEEMIIAVARVSMCCGRVEPILRRWEGRSLAEATTAKTARDVP